MNQLKDPCLSFARDRYDLLKYPQIPFLVIFAVVNLILLGFDVALRNYFPCRSLSVGEIQTVLEGGCPNLFRKVVNSAKRLRAYMALDEGEVRSLPLPFLFFFSGAGGGREARNYSLNVIVFTCEVNLTTALGEKAVLAPGQVMLVPF